jgi:hypothetical protein
MLLSSTQQGWKHCRVLCTHVACQFHLCLHHSMFNASDGWGVGLLPQAPRNSRAQTTKLDAIEKRTLRGPARHLALASYEPPVTFEMTSGAR